MKKQTMTRLSIVIAAGLVAVLSCPALAKVTGVCSNCHTMHFSQGGADWNASGGPHGSLLTNDCVACHTGDNTGSNTIPYVHSTTADYGTDGTDGDTLAGGNFRWVETTDAHGHNVEGIASYEMDPPGYPGDGRGGRPATWLASQQVNCAGTYGCHGDPANEGSAGGIAGAHHGTATFGSDYRWLKGIAGLEWNTAGATGGKWEFKPTAAEHNQYKGADRTTETEIVNTTISSLCGQCHGNFHADADVSYTAWGSAWKRHPTDFDMGNTDVTSEYRSYNGDGTYSVSAPVASDNVLAVKSTVSFSDDTIVMCLSCHRAHGTPNNDLLRWAYTMDAGSGTDNGGCFVCHTTKDDA